MTTEEILLMLKVDLGISNNAYDTRLTQYIEQSKALIGDEGIKLNESIEDAQLVTMYAGYLWRNREKGNGMPRMLRFALNNRKIAELRGEIDG